MSELVPRDELQATIEARREVGADMEPALTDAFVERIEKRLAAGVIVVCAAVALIAVVSSR